MNGGGVDMSTNTNTPQFLVDAACHKRCRVWSHTHADTCSVCGDQVAYGRRGAPSLCIPLWLQQDSEANRRREATCCCALLVSNSRNRFRLGRNHTLSGRSFRFTRLAPRQPPSHPGSRSRAQQPVSLALSARPPVPAGRFYFTSSFNISHRCCVAHLRTTRSPTGSQSIYTSLLHKTTLCDS